MSKKRNKSESLTANDLRGEAHVDASQTGDPLQSQDGTEAEQFNSIVKTFDSTLAKSAKAAKLDPSLTSTDLSGKGGTIESVELHNFMCHEMLKVDLMEHINFIVGNNGSGKSAVLTALTVCLGGRASSTQRAASLEALIREGATEARVIVVISNVGVLRFKSDQYGDSIVIERRFRRGSHTNSYKTRSGDGRRVISEKKDEIVAICDNFNIQVDNPLSVLTQETAKKFLVNSTPRDLYDFFMRGTQLEQLSIDYAYALDRMKSMQSSLNATKNSWPTLTEDIECLATTLRNLERLQESKQRTVALRAEIAWAMVHSKEKELRKMQTDLNKTSNSLNLTREQVNEITSKLDTTAQLIKQAETELLAIYSSKRPVEARRIEAEQSLSGKQVEVEELTADANEINVAVRKLRRELSDIEKRLEDEKIRQDDASNQRSKLELERLGLVLVECNRQLAQLTEAEHELRRQTGSATDDIDRAKEIVANLEREKSHLTAQLEQSQSVKQNQLRYYGDRIPEVLERIKVKARSFHHAPVGPIGVHVKLKDPQWAKAMDAIIGSHMKSFITFDHHDRQLLQGILKTCNCDNPVIVLSPAPIDISDGEPGPQFVTALRVLDISNPSVKKALVIFTSLEKILLIADRTEARNAIMARHRNAESAYTMTHRITATKNSLSFFAITASSHVSPFESSGDRVKTISRKLEEKEHALRIASRDVAALSAAIERHVAEERLLQEQAIALRQNVIVTKKEIRSLEDTLHQSNDANVLVFENERDDISRNIDRLVAQFRDNTEAKYRLADDIDNLNRAIQDANQELEGLEQEAEKKTAFISKTSERRRVMNRELARCQDELAALETSVQQLTQSESEMSGQLSAMAEDASKICTRIETNRSIPALERELMKLEALVASSADGALNIDQTRAEFEEKTSELERSKRNVRINENILDDMKIALDKRQRQWEDLRRGISKRSNMNFFMALQSRGFKGNLEYDHANRELHINVQIEQGHEDDKVPTRCDIRQLSGGEKSFGTTCLLLSLWDAMGCPIRCLDEFDVYMDAVNRRLVVEMLINNARNSGTQFILITPVSDRNTVHMVRMGDPQRAHSQAN